MSPSATEVSSDLRADALVVFGITGDLARKMTLRSLYRLEARGLLDCPIVGVAAPDWTVEQLREHARTAIAATEETVDESTFGRLARRLDYVGGDFGDAATFERLARVLRDYKRPVYYLEVPPSLFATVVHGLGDANLLPAVSRVLVEKPFGHDLRSARSLAKELHEHLDESQIYRVDHFLGKMGVDELHYLRFANAILDPVWNRSYVSSVQITLAERFGVQDRGRFYDPVGALRDVVLNHMLQMLAATAMEPPAGGDPTALKDARVAVLRSIGVVDAKLAVRGQYEGYLDVDGVAAGSKTDTYAALRLEIDNWRWMGVPFFLRTGKRLPVTQTEIRVIFKEPPRLGFLGATRRHPEPNQLVVKIDPEAGVRLTLDAHRAGERGPGPIDLDMEFAEQGGEAPSAYEVLLDAALEGESNNFVRQDGVEEAWRIGERVLAEPGPTHPYAPGSWGPKEADELVAGHGGWYGPWLS